MKCLHSYRMDYSFLSKNLISLTCDGEAVMVEKYNGVAVLKKSFTSTVVWHGAKCANHRLELSEFDAVKKVAGINRFKSFNKLYIVYHAMESQLTAKLLEVKLLKVCWIASSFRSVKTVWTSYEALVHHFQKASEDSKRDETEKSMFDGLLRKISDKNFLLDLELMAV